MSRTYSAAIVRMTPIAIALPKNQIKPPAITPAIIGTRASRPSPLSSVLKYAAAASAAMKDAMRTKARTSSDIQEKSESKKQKAESGSEMEPVILSRGDGEGSQSRRHSHFEILRRASPTQDDGFLLSAFCSLLSHLSVCHSERSEEPGRVVREARALQSHPSPRSLAHARDDSGCFKKYSRDRVMSWRIWLVSSSAERNCCSRRRSLWK